MSRKQASKSVARIQQAIKQTGMQSKALKRRIGARLPEINNDETKTTHKAPATNVNTAVLLELRCGRVWLKRKRK